MPNRFHLIRKLNVIWEVSIGNLHEYDRKYRGVFSDETWNEFWTLIAGMQGLQVLKVYLSGHPRFSERELQRFLQPLMAVEQCDNFVLYLGWDDISCDYTAMMDRLGKTTPFPFEFCILTEAEQDPVLL